MTRRRELVMALKELLDKTGDSKKLARSTAAYLLDTRQSKEVGAILRDLETVRLNQDGILEVHVTVARPLSESAKSRIKSLFDAGKIIIHEVRDPSILGGVRVRAHDRQFDDSVRTRLQRLKAGA